MKTWLTSLSFCLIFALTLPAQTLITDDITSALEDGGLSSPQNVVKVDLLAPFAGELSIGYERVFNKWLSLDLTGGIGTSFYLIEFRNVLGIFGLADPTQDLSNISGGYSFSVAPRIYPQKRAPDLYFFHPGYRFQRINRSKNYDLVLEDYFIGFGYNVYLTPRLYIEYLGGLGIRSTSYRSQPGYPDLSELNMNTLSIPVSIRLGYIF